MSFKFQPKIGRWIKQITKENFQKIRFPQLLVLISSSTKSLLVQKTNSFCKAIIKGKFYGQKKRLISIKYGSARKMTKGIQINE